MAPAHRNNGTIPVIAYQQPGCVADTKQWQALGARADAGNHLPQYSRHRLNRNVEERSVAGNFRSSV